MSEQIDIAVDLGVVPPPLPEILNLRQLVESAPAAPPQIIEGLLDLALSVASGEPWWGRACTRLPVVYINFELHVWAVAQRINALCAARPECKNLAETLHVWNLRGHNADLTLLRPKLEDQLARYQFGLIILDPAYKVLGDRDENANGEIAGLMNELEALAQSSGAAVVVAHHFAKGDSTSKEAMDRMSGAGAWARDPDSILVLTPHEEPGCFTVTSILRNLPQLPEFVVEWAYPVMRLARELNPEALRRPQSRNKICTDREFVEATLGQPRNFTNVIREAEVKLNMSRRTAMNYLKRLTDAGVVRFSSGLYWAKPESGLPLAENTGNL